ncbi:MAG: metallophosphoesterase family protein, partial [Deltaproteobacteria bacterium]
MQDVQIRGPDGGLPSGCFLDSIRIDKDIRKVGEALKIAVISDTHGNLMRATSIIEGIRPFNLIVHLGDHASDLVKLSEIYDSRAVGLLGNEDMTAPVKAGADSGTKG